MLSIWLKYWKGYGYSGGGYGGYPGYGYGYNPYGYGIDQFYSKEMNCQLNGQFYFIGLVGTGTYGIGYGVNGGVVG